MGIRLAAISDLDIVIKITNETISEIYPHYYPDGAVNFFVNHHNHANIISDIINNSVFL